MYRSGAVERGRESFRHRSWAEAFARLAAAEDALDPSDLERLATAAFLIGRDAESDEAWARAHREWSRRREPERAARCAFWLAFGLLDRGEQARSSGWMGRARRALESGSGPCVERGYLMLPIAIRAFAEGDSGRAESMFGAATEIGERFDDLDLTMLGRHGRGRALIRLGRSAEGMALLDEVMVAVTAGEVSPIVAGDAYCSLLGACQETFDVRRAREWTTALDRWCASQPDLVRYRAECRVRRAEVLQLGGAWADAMGEARRACEPASPAVRGAALYQQAELHRLRGELERAEDAYRQASRWGRKPQPGMALLRLAQGRVDAAQAAIRRALDEARERRLRSRLLGACVEIALAANDVAAARVAADELGEVADELGAPLLRAVADQSAGAVLLAEGDARTALALLRRAGATWAELEAPYEAARSRVLVAGACLQLGDGDSAELELDAAAVAFRELGAAADLAGVRDLARQPVRAGMGGLTRRELEVLRLVASGRTNRAIARALFISEKTVARHLSNIFTKLGVSTRSAATAYAYRRHLA